MPLPDFEGGRITALLGPTNTGKTHRAVEQMLRHRTGMMGFPLRLLAREVYDRVSARVGEASVALITGEERRIPPNPRYFLCTVESMPVSRPVDFLAIDEVQLGAHPERGHIYTDRLLNARGVRETMFMGSDTITPLMETLVPTAQIERKPRFSKLTYGGHKRLGALPARTAVVAFSASRVYELAERLRSRHGGVAVVMGALSPRTRNAQVAMFQSGEVPVMVATDAIGMGLNMDVDHVAFAGTRKFDGRKLRELEAAEIGQIAGRAGRFQKDGTFGPTDREDPFDPEVILSVESHIFRPLRRLWWRSTDLSFGSIAELRESLLVAPPRRVLAQMRGASDEVSLEKLAAMPPVAALAKGWDAVALLWEICRIPDFRKTLTDDHFQLQARLFRQIAESGQVSEDWLAERVGRLDRSDGDIEALMTRIAWTRTWTYVSYRRDWLADPEHWQARTRRIEDRLSDALHERLTQRFVDQLATARGGGRRAQLEGVELSEDGFITAARQPLGQLKGFSLKLNTSLRPRDQMTLLQRGAALLGKGIDARVQRLVQDGDDAFAVDSAGRIHWRGGPIASLEAGPVPGAPGVEVLPSPLLGPGATARIARRLTAWVRDRVEALAAPLRRGPAQGLSADGKALVLLLVQWLGVVHRSDAPRSLTKKDRQLLARLGVRLGTQAIYAGDLIGGDTLSLRAMLAYVHFGVRPIPRPPDGGAVTVAVEEGRPRALYAAMGFVPQGPLAVRADMAERLAARLRELGREGEDGAFALPEEAMSWLGSDRETLERVVLATGYQRAKGGHFRKRPRKPRR